MTKGFELHQHLCCDALMFSTLLIESLINLVHQLVNFIAFLFYFWRNPFVKPTHHLGSSFESNSSLLYNRLYYQLPRKQTASIDDFDKQSVIFSNSWTTLYCVKSLKDNNLYILREYSKEVVKKYNLQSMVNQESHILFSIEYWLFPLGIAYFEDNQHYYLTFDYTSGLRLDLVLKHCKNGFPENWACFISAQVLIAMDYLQKANILMHDIHPQNIILKSNGYIKIISINQLTMLEVDSTISEETRGRIYFIPPEYIKRNFWTIESDYWTFGIFLHLLVTGRTPFDSRRGLLSSMTRIVSNRICIDPKCTYLLRHLLNHILCLSLQDRYTLLDIIRHRWYCGINFQKLCRQTLKPPRIHFIIFNQINRQQVPQSSHASLRTIEKVITV